MTLFTKNLRGEAAKKGLSLHALAHKAGLSYQTVFYASRGKSVSPGTAQKICDALCCAFTDIFEIEEGCEHDR